MKQLIASKKISRVSLTPQMLESLLSVWSDCDSLSRIILTGEEPASELTEQFSNIAAPGCSLLREYGVPETLNAASARQNFENTIESGAVRLGRPIANAVALVLDRDQHLAPIGVMGELYVGGACLARGYLNRNDLTQQSFVANPHSDRMPNASRLFRTGLIARWLPDGLLELETKDRSSAVALDGPREPPEGGVEEMVAAIWTEVLKVEGISRNDHFFALGGHSLRAVQVIARIRTSLGIEVPLRLIFECPTLRGLSDGIIEQLIQVDDLSEASLEELLTGPSQEQARAGI